MSRASVLVLLLLTGLPGKGDEGLRELPADLQLLEAPDAGVPGPLKRMVSGAAWPAPAVLERRQRLSAELADDTRRWFEQLVQPEWLAPDLKQRLRAVRKGSDGRDAIVARYAVHGARVQLVATRFHVYVTVQPENDARASDTAAYAEAAVGRYLRAELPHPFAPFAPKWERYPAGIITVGYQPRASADDWRETLSYASDGRAIVYCAAKEPAQLKDSHGRAGFVAYTDAAEISWFGR